MAINKNKILDDEMHQPFSSHKIANQSISFYKNKLIGFSKIAHRV